MAEIERFYERSNPSNLLVSTSVGMWMAIIKAMFGTIYHIPNIAFSIFPSLSNVNMILSVIFYIVSNSN